MIQGYNFALEDLPALVRVGFIPEQPKPESGVILDWLAAHGQEYDHFSFSVRLGTPITPDPSHLPAVQKAGVFSSLKRIDCVAVKGEQATIVEAKIRVSTDALGKVLMYRQLWRNENPDGPDPKLLVIGRTADDDVLAAHSAQGIDVMLYEITPAGA
jgi:hypothetical protein